MNAISILVVEDDLSFALEMEMMISELGYRFLGNPKTSDDAFKAIAKEKPDLIIMDINIQGKIDGISVAEVIQARNIPIIFITSFKSSDYFERAKKILPAGYLVKPFHLLTLRGVIEKVLPDIPNTSINKEDEHNLLLKSSNTFYRVSFDDILYIQVDGNYCYFFMEEKKFVLKRSLKRVIDQINKGNKFVRIHRKYVIHKKYIKNFNAKSNTIHLNGIDIPVGRQYKNNVMNILKEI